MTEETNLIIAGDIKTIGHTVRFIKTPAKVAITAPVLVKHSREVLGQLGYDQEIIGSLIVSGAVIAE